jgi:hypothetical protein
MERSNKPLFALSRNGVRFDTILVDKRRSQLQELRHSDDRFALHADVGLGVNQGCYAPKFQSLVNFSMR